jgi:hypothetical protein
VAERRVALGVVAVLAALLAACAAQLAPPPGTAGRGPADFPNAYYQRLAAQGKPVFRVDPVRSLVVIEVRRGGSLARFGHDHVIASHDVTGYIAPDEGHADLYVPLDALVVDEPALRAEAGFDTQPSAADIAGTRGNMMEKVLMTGRYPYALIGVTARAADGTAQEPRVALTLHGVTRPVGAVPRFERTGDEVSATGTLSLEQSRFGIVPFSILGGAIAVQDRVNISYRIRAHRVE